MDGKSDYFTAKNIFRHGQTYCGLVLASLFVRLFDLGVCMHEIHNTPRIIKPPLLFPCATLLPLIFMTSVHPPPPHGPRSSVT